MYPAIIRVIPSGDFTLAVTFDNGREGVLDMKPYLNRGIFKAIATYEDFKRVRIAFDAIAWDGGPDLDPWFVYSHCLIVSNA